MCGPIYSRWQNIFNKKRQPEKDHCAVKNFFLLRTVIQGEGLGHAMQFAQRLHDTADEGLVTALGNFVADAYREPDLAEELDRAHEAAATEVDEETPSPTQQRQLLRAHVNQGQPSIGEFCRALRNGRCRRGVVRWVKTLFQMSRVRPELCRQQPCRKVTVSLKFVASTRWKFGIR